MSDDPKNKQLSLKSIAATVMAVAVGGNALSAPSSQAAINPRPVEKSERGLDIDRVREQQREMVNNAPANPTILFINRADLPSNFETTESWQEQLDAVTEVIDEQTSRTFTEEQREKMTLAAITPGAETRFFPSLDVCMVVNSDKSELGSGLMKYPIKPHEGGYHDPMTLQERVEFTSAHEALGHCLDPNTGPEEILRQEDATFLDVLYAQHRGEVYADVQGSINSILNGDSDIALKVADMRALASWDAGQADYDNSQQSLSTIVKMFGGTAEGLDSIELTDRIQSIPEEKRISAVMNFRLTQPGASVYYNSPVLRALDEKVQDMGIEEFRSMDPKDREKMAQGIIEEYDITKSEFLSLTNFNTHGGEGYLQILESSSYSEDTAEAEFLKDYISDVMHSTIRIEKSEVNPSYRPRSNPEIFNEASGADQIPRSLPPESNPIAPTVNQYSRPTI